MADLSDDLNNINTMYELIENGTLRRSVRFPLHAWWPADRRTAPQESHVAYGRAFTALAQRHTDS